MKLNKTITNIAREYEVGRFSSVFENMFELKNFFACPKNADPAQSARLIMIDYVILDSRFKEVLNWIKTEKGDFPDLWMRHHHMNMLTNFSGNLCQEIPFYRDSPMELKVGGRELYQKCFKFYQLRPYLYIHGLENLKEDVEETVLLAKSFLDNSYDYLSLCIRK